MSFGHFLKFLRALKPDWCDDALIDNISGEQSRCLKSVSRQHTIEELERKRQEIGTEIKPEQFARVLSSKETSDTFSFCGFRPFTQTVTEENFCRHQNRLILCIQLTNGKRSGILTDLQKGEVDQAKAVDGMKVAFVSSGKTIRSYGPSKVVFSAELYQTLEAVKKVHQGLGIEHDFIFSTFRGLPLTAKKNIVAYLQLAWSEFFDTATNSNLIRKSIVSMSRESPIVSREQQLLTATMPLLEDSVYPHGLLL